MQKGVSLIEVIVSVAVFAVLAVSVYGVFTAIIKGITFYREKATVSFLASQHLETVRNMSYSQIGTIQGNPNGPLADLPNPTETTLNGDDYQIYYAISYVDDPADGTILLGTDASPNDYKQVKLYVKNLRTEIINSFLTTVSPSGLEGMATGGALYIKVFDAVGQPVAGASIHITNNAVAPTIDLTRTSNSNGEWVEVGLSASSNSYNLTVSKSGYSADGTYAISEQNPNPVKSDATILNGQITQISFSIDKLSSLVLNTLNQLCVSLQDVQINVAGSKLIGTPDVLKFNNSYTSNSSGQIFLNNLEWDNYIPALPLSSSYMVYGSSPIQQVNVLPDTSQTFSFVLGPKTTNSILVAVKDGSTNNPVEGAKVELERGGIILEKLTSGSVWSQQNWQSAQGQEDDGNIDVNGIPSGLRLIKIGSSYVYSGNLTSSVFDTGTDSTTYTAITWEPTSQDPSTEIKFQLAANNDNTTWNFIGPDGTNSTYYTVPGTTIGNLNNNRYVRYKVFLSTTDPLKTPVLTGININYVSGCSTPGQAMFAGLSAGEYDVTVSLSGYQTQTATVDAIGNKVFQVLLGQ